MGSKKSLSKRRGASDSGTGAIWVVSIFGILALLGMVIYGHALSSSSSSLVQQQQQQQQQQRKAADVDKEGGAGDTTSSLRNNKKKQIIKKLTGREIFTLKVQDVGRIKIVLRPDWSPESVEYIHTMVQVGCKDCQLYRSEKQGLLQGIVFNRDEVPVPMVKGKCPPGLEDKVKNECPEWDPQCNCHGPIMEKGHVAWAAGQTGPDFFIDGYDDPALWWGTQHTAWGKVEDDASFAIIDYIWDLPTYESEGLNMLKDILFFDMELTQEEIEEVVYV